MKQKFLSNQISDVCVENVFSSPGQPWRDPRSVCDPNASGLWAPGAMRQLRRSLQKTKQSEAKRIRRVRFQLKNCLLSRKVLQTVEATILKPIMDTQKTSGAKMIEIHQQSLSESNPPISLHLAYSTTNASTRADSRISRSLSRAVAGKASRTKPKASQKVRWAQWMQRQTRRLECVLSLHKLVRLLFINLLFLKLCRCRCTL